MGFDHELCYRMWINDFHVGHYFPFGFKNDEQQGSTYTIAGIEKRSKQMKFMEEYITKKYKNNLCDIKTKINLISE